MDRRPILAISMGDPAGIGAEIAVKALLEADLYSVAKPLVVGDVHCIADAISFTRSDVAVNVIDRPCKGLCAPAPST